jgi:hypothetical protein
VSPDRANEKRKSVQVRTCSELRSICAFAFEVSVAHAVSCQRLLSSKTYEMQLFHMSSMKLGLDQAVLKGFENGSAEVSTM